MSQRSGSRAVNGRAIPIISIAIVCLVLCSTRAFAGRPLTIDDAAPVAKGQFELEVGFAHSRPEEGGREQRFPVIGLSYGLFEDLELGVAIQRINVDEKREPPVKGFEDLHLTAKYQTAKQTSHLPDLSFALYVKIPTANQRKGLSTGRVDENFLVIATKDFSSLALDLNVGYLVVNSPPEEKLKNRTLAGLAIRWKADDRWVLVSEFFGQSRKARQDDNEASFQMGARYSLAPSVVLDAAVGRSLRSVGIRIQATFGLTWTFPLDF